MMIDGQEVDVHREDVPGDGCADEGCPKYYESGGQGRCGACDCFTTGMQVVGKACPVAVEAGEVRHSGPFGQFDQFRDRF